MKKKENIKRSLSHWYLMILFIYFISINCVVAEPDPLPSMIFSENYANEARNYLLLQRLKQVTELKHEILDDERELTEAQLALQTMLEENSQRLPHQLDLTGSDGEVFEKLPAPSAMIQPEPVQHSNAGKRTSYIALCHFKICNMGRKRQLRAA